MSIPLKNKPASKPVYVKLTPGSGDYRRVAQVAEILGLDMTKAARFMMRNGYLGFKRFLVKRKSGGL